MSVRSRASVADVSRRRLLWFKTRYSTFWDTLLALGELNAFLQKENILGEFTISKQKIKPFQCWWRQKHKYSICIHLLGAWLSDWGYLKVVSLIQRIEDRMLPAAEDKNQFNAFDIFADTCFIHEHTYVHRQRNCYSSTVVVTIIATRINNRIYTTTTFTINTITSIIILTAILIANVTTTTPKQ